MTLSRRQFVAACALSPLAVLPGCSEDRRRGAHVPHLADEPFELEPPRRYGNPGIYDNYARTHGVYLVTNRHGMLVALAGACTCFDQPLDADDSSSGLADSVQRFSEGSRRAFPAGYHPEACRVLINPMSQQFQCPCHGSRYTSDGLPRGDGPAHRALERCQIRVTGTRADPRRRLIVDPTRRYRHEAVDARHWSNPNSAYLFDA